MQTIPKAVQPSTSFSFKAIFCKLFILFLFLATSFFLFSNSFNNPFQFDDIRQISENAALYQQTFPVAYFADRFPYRTFPYITFWWNAQWHGQNPLGFHLVNALLHGGNAFLLFLIGLNLWNESKKRKSIPAAFLAAGLFLGHPLGSEMVNLVSHRTEILALFFSLMAINLSFAVHKNKSSFIILGLLVLLAVDSKASAASLPLILGYQLFLFREKKRQSLLLWGVIFFLTVMVLWKGGIIWQKTGTNIFSYAITQMSAWVKYICLYFFPLEIPVDFDLPVSSINGITASALIGMFGGSFFCWKRGDVKTKFLVGWFWLALLPASSIIPRNDAFFFYRFYSASAPLALGICFCIFEIRNKYLAFSFRTVLVFGIIFFSILTHQRNFIFRNEIVFWEYALKNAPNKERTLNNYAQALLKSGDTDRAIQKFEENLKKYPDQMAALNNLGVAYQKKRDFKRARQFLERAKTLDPNNFEIIRNWTFLLRAEGKTEEALVALEDFQSHFSEDNAELYYLLGSIYAEVNRQQEAEVQLQKAISLEPKKFAFLLALARLKEQQGRPDQAREILFKILEFHPQMAEGYFQLGMFYKRAAQKQDAALCLEVALQKNPFYLQALNNLGNLYLEERKFVLAKEFYERALAIEPRFRAATMNLLLLEKLNSENQNEKPFN